MIREKDLNLLFDKANKKICDKNCEKEESNLAKIPNSYVIKLTTECNMRCQYCYMGNRNIEQMSENLFENVLNQILQLRKKFTIYLHGGEPCLRIDLIRLLKKWINDNNLCEDITIMLQTNGTIITDELIDLIKDLNINVGISIDGSNCYSNSERRFNDGSSSIDCVRRNLEKLLHKNIKIGIFSVLSNINADYLVESFKLFSELGVRSYVVNPLVLWGRARDMRCKMASQELVYKTYKSLIDWINDYNNSHKNDLVTERNLHWWYQAYSYGVKGYMCNCSPCGAGIQTIAIGPMGDVFVCDQYYGDERFKIGQLFSNDLRNIINNSHYVISKLRNLYNVEACKKCIWRYVCSGGCSAASFYYNNEKNDGVAPYCEAYKKIFEYMELKSQCSNLLL